MFGSSKLGASRYSSGFQRPGSRLPNQASRQTKGPPIKNMEDLKKVTAERLQKPQGHEKVEVTKKTTIADILEPIREAKVQELEKYFAPLSSHEENQKAGSLLKEKIENLAKVCEELQYEKVANHRQGVFNHCMGEPISGSLEDIEIDVAKGAHFQRNRIEIKQIAQYDKKRGQEIVYGRDIAKPLNLKGSIVVGIPEEYQREASLILGNPQTFTTEEILLDPHDGLRDVVGKIERIAPRTGVHAKLIEADDCERQDSIHEKGYCVELRAKETGQPIFFQRKEEGDKHHGQKWRLLTANDQGALNLEGRITIELQKHSTDDQDAYKKISISLRPTMTVQDLVKKIHEEGSGAGISAFCQEVKKRNKKEFILIIEGAVPERPVILKRFDKDGKVLGQKDASKMPVPTAHTFLKAPYLSVTRHDEKWALKSHDKNKPLNLTGSLSVGLKHSGVKEENEEQDVQNTAPMMGPALPKELLKNTDKKNSLCEGKILIALDPSMTLENIAEKINEKTPLTSVKAICHEMHDGTHTLSLKALKPQRPLLFERLDKDQKSMTPEAFLPDDTIHDLGKSLEPYFPDTIMTPQRDLQALYKINDYSIDWVASSTNLIESTEDGPRGLQGITCRLKRPNEGNPFEFDLKPNLEEIFVVIKKFMETYNDLQWFMASEEGYQSSSAQGVASKIRHDLPSIIASGVDIYGDGRPETLISFGIMASSEKPPRDPDFEYTIVKDKVSHMDFTSGNFGEGDSIFYQKVMGNIEDVGKIFGFHFETSQEDFYLSKKKGGNPLKGPVDICVKKKEDGSFSVTFDVFQNERKFVVIQPELKNDEGKVVQKEIKDVEYEILHAGTYEGTITQSQTQIESRSAQITSQKMIFLDDHQKEIPGFSLADTSTMPELHHPLHIKLKANEHNAVSGEIVFKNQFDKTETFHAKIERPGDDVLHISAPTCQHLHGLKIVYSNLKELEDNKNLEATMQWDPKNPINGLTLHVYELDALGPNQEKRTRIFISEGIGVQLKAFLESTLASLEKEIEEGEDRFTRDLEKLDKKTVKFEKDIDKQRQKLRKTAGTWQKAQQIGKTNEALMNAIAGKN